MQIFDVHVEFGNFRKVSFRLFFSQQNQFPEKENKYILNSSLDSMLSKISSSSLSNEKNRNTSANVV